MVAVVGGLQKNRLQAREYEKKMQKLSNFFVNVFLTKSVLYTWPAVKPFTRCTAAHARLLAPSEAGREN